MRPTFCQVDLAAISANVQALREHVAPTPVCAVVKANGYGHGAVQVANASLDAGAQWLAVALVEEGIELREAGITAPVLLLTEPTLDSLPAAVAHQLTPTLYRKATIDTLATIAVGSEPLKVHVAVDSGMRRVGAELDDVGSLVKAVGSHDSLELEAIWTHCPVADEPDNPFTDRQLDAFSRSVEAVGIDVPTHVANSACAIIDPERNAFMVRCGISIYGIDPDPAVAGAVGLAPAMSIRSEVSFVKRIGAGEGVGYGHRFVAAQETTIATVPIGYADGVRRDLGLRGGSVLIEGTAYPIVGVVTMDQLMVDLGEDEVRVGDEVVLIGRQQDAELTAASIAATLDTIPYEVVCAVSVRVPRVYLGV